MAAGPVEIRGIGEPTRIGGESRNQPHGRHEAQNHRQDPTADDGSWSCDRQSLRSWPKVLRGKSHFWKSILGFSVRFSLPAPHPSPLGPPCPTDVPGLSRRDHPLTGAGIRRCPTAWHNPVAFTWQRTWRAECRLSHPARGSPSPTPCRGPLASIHDRRRAPDPLPAVEAPGRRVWTISERWPSWLSRIRVSLSGR